MQFLIPLHVLIIVTVHRGAFFQFLFRWIYYCHSNKSTAKETGKTHLCAVLEFIFQNVPKTKTGFLEKWGKCPIPQSTVFRDASGIKSSNGYEANRKCRDFNFLHYFNKRSLPIPIMWTYQM